MKRADWKWKRGEVEMKLGEVWHNDTWIATASSEQIANIDDIVETLEEIMRSDEISWNYNYNWECGYTLYIQQVWWDLH